MQAREPNINFANPMIQRGSINTCKHAHTYPESTLSTILQTRYSTIQRVQFTHTIVFLQTHYSTIQRVQLKHTQILNPSNQKHIQIQTKKKKRIISLESLTFGLRP